MQKSWQFTTLCYIRKTGNYKKVTCEFNIYFKRAGEKSPALLL